MAPRAKLDFLAEQAASQLAWMREATWHPNEHSDSTRQPLDSAAPSLADDQPHAATPASNNDAPPSTRQRLVGSAAQQPLWGPRTTRGMLGHPPPRQQSKKIRVVRWSGAGVSTVHTVDAATVPLWLREGQWPGDSRAWRETSSAPCAAQAGVEQPAAEQAAQLAAAAAAGNSAASPHPAAAPPSQSARAAFLSAEAPQSVRGKKRSREAGQEGDEQSEGLHAFDKGWPGDPASALLAAVEGASASYNAVPQSAQDAEPASTDGSTHAQRARHRKRSHETATDGDRAAKPIAVRKSASGGLRRALPGFESASQKQRDAGTQNPAWALLQVVRHCTDVEVTDAFHAW